MTARAAWIAAPRWLKLVAALSLVLNFAVIGLAAGVALRADDWRGHRGSMSMRHLMRALPENISTERREQIERTREQVSALRRARSDARSAAIEEIGRPALDRAALEAAFGAMRASSLEYREASHRLMVEVISGLSDEERLALAKKMRDHQFWKKRRWREERREE